MLRSYKFADLWLKLLILFMKIQLYKKFYQVKLKTFNRKDVLFKLKGITQ